MCIDADDFLNRFVDTIDSSLKPADVKIAQPHHQRVIGASVTGTYSHQLIGHGSCKYIYICVLIVFVYIILTDYKPYNHI